MQIIELIKALFYGIVEGITEWLPVSSTGHMILFEEFVKFQQSDAFMEMFRVVIQLGAILAVVVLFWDKIRFLELMVSHFSGNYARLGFGIVAG